MGQPISEAAEWDDLELARWEGEARAIADELTNRSKE